MNEKNYCAGTRISKYTLRNKPIGKGSYGTVYLAKSDDNIFLAAKKLDISELINNQKKYQSFISELKLYHKLNHDHIIKLYDVKRTKSNVYLFLEYCDCETLLSFMHNYSHMFKHNMTTNLLQFFIKQIIEGMSYMASKNCIHRDLKLDNIMLSQKNELQINHNFKKIFQGTNESLLKNMSLGASLPAFNWLNEITQSPVYYDDEYTNDERNFEKLVISYTIKLIDLGFAKELDLQGRTDSFCGSPFQLAPEVWEMAFDQVDKEKCNKKSTMTYTTKADLWSLGVSIYQMAFNTYPFVEKTHQLIYDKVKAGIYKIDKKAKNVTLELVDLIHGLLKINPMKRYDYATLINHPFLTKNPNELTRFEGSNTLNNYHNEIMFNANDDTPSLLKDTIPVLLGKGNKEDNEILLEKEREKEKELEKYIDCQFYDENCSLIEYETFFEDWEDGWLIISVRNTKA